VRRLSIRGGEFTTIDDGEQTVIGDTVNTAARFQDAAKENQIIISEACYNEVKEAFKCERIGDIELKNKAQSITVYQVIE